jgi:hypothetical protein
MESFARRDARPDLGLPVERTPAVRLDDYLAQAPGVDLIKMDIEGAEARGDPGDLGLPRAAPPALVLEFHSEVGWPAIEALLGCGYGLESLEGTAAARLPTPDEVPYQLVARYPEEAS